MNKKSLFTQTIWIIVIAAFCLLLTVGASLLAGSFSGELFDLKELNLSNAIPVLLIGGFISCIVIGICLLFVARTAFFKAKDFLKETHNESGGTKK